MAHKGYSHCAHIVTSASGTWLSRHGTKAKALKALTRHPGAHLELHCKPARGGNIIRVGGTRKRRKARRKSKR